MVFAWLGIQKTVCDQNKVSIVHSFQEEKSNLFRKGILGTFVRLPEAEGSSVFIVQRGESVLKAKNASRISKSKCTGASVGIVSLQ